MKFKLRYLNFTKLHLSYENGCFLGGDYIKEHLSLCDQEIVLYLSKIFNFNFYSDFNFFTEDDFYKTTE